MASKKSDSQQRVIVRRSPRLSAFVLIFAVLGFFITLVVTSLFDVDPAVGFATLFAYFSLYGITGSIGVGIVLWLVLDLLSRRSEKEITMEREKGS